MGTVALRAAGRGAAALARGDFADSLVVADLFAVARAFAAVVLAEVTDSPRDALLEDAFFPEEVLAVFPGVFLRVFLDIRLPFVAFSGSTNGLLRVVFWQTLSPAGRWANLMTSE